MIGTIGSLAQQRYSVTAYCHACDYRAEIDLEAIARIYGKAAVVRGSADLVPARIGGWALVCGVATCRRRNTSLRISRAGCLAGVLSE